MTSPHPSYPEPADQPSPEYGFPAPVAPPVEDLDTTVDPLSDPISDPLSGPAFPPPAPLHSVPAPAAAPVAPPVPQADPSTVVAPPLPPTPSPVAPTPFAVPEAPPAPIAPAVPAPSQVVAPSPVAPSIPPPPPSAPPAASQGDSYPTLSFQAPVLEQETANDAHQLKEPMLDVAGRPELERLLSGLVSNGGSDLHLVHGQPPRFRQAGELLSVAGEMPLYSDDIERLIRGILSPTAWDEFVRNSDIDTSYAMDTEEGAAVTSRFRVNVYRSMGAIGVVIRVIPSKIVTLEQLGLLPQIRGLAKLPRGLVLFCGPTGSGKSTSMAALVNEMNETRPDRIFTLEDPVEFVHTSKKCLVSHREIGEDTASFEEGLRRVRRQDPDIILVGEMRDYETIAAAIEAADTGHLVIGTLHTNSAPETISRIINSFPAGQQAQIRTTLSSTLKAVICQTLVPSPKAAKGRVCATEIMLVNGAISANIRDNDIKAIEGALVDRSIGNISLDAHLVELVRSGDITKKEALKKASSERAFEQMLGTNRENM